MRVRNGYWLVGRAGRWSGGLKAVRAGARRGEAAPVVCGGSGVSSGVGIRCRGVSTPVPVEGRRPAGRRPAAPLRLRSLCGLVTTTPH